MKGGENPAIAMGIFLCRSREKRKRKKTTADCKKKMFIFFESSYIKRRKIKGEAEKESGEEAEKKEDEKGTKEDDI